MDDILSGLPKTIPSATFPKISLRIVEELKEIGAITNPNQLSQTMLELNLDEILQKRMENGDEQAPFQLGQVHFEKNNFSEAWKYFQLAYEKYHDARARYQIGVMLYDDLVNADCIPGIANPKTEACRIFKELTELKYGAEFPIGQRELVYYAAYNLGRAYHQGYGVYPSIEKALEYFLIAANNGERNACIYAQTALGYLYSGPEIRDLEKAFYWHSEACGNGSVESQAALGVMYLYGLGVKQDWTNALICLSDSANRGSLYGKASLAYLYYKRKMFTNAAVISSKIVYFDADEVECDEADCLKNFVERAKAMACFIYARCLHKGIGVEKDESLAMELYSRSIEHDAVLACRYQKMAQLDEL